MSPVARDPSAAKRRAAYCTIFAATKMCVHAITSGTRDLTSAQITCLYDMDIVFQPSGNFDEVYLYVSARSHL